MRQGITNQQYTMTAANNLADLLSDMLNNMQNPSMGSGKGKGKSESLPDIIQKQKGLGEKIKDGIKKGKQKGKEKGKEKGEGQGEEMTGEQYQIYQEQQALRKSLEELLDKEGKGSKEGKQALNKMKELEQQLLDKGFDNQVLEKMLQLEHELLKLKDASLKQGKDSQRKSETNSLNFEERSIKALQLKKLFFNPNEILNRQALPLQNNYKKKVQEYFKND